MQGAESWCKWSWLEQRWWIRISTVQMLGSHSAEQQPDCLGQDERQHPSPLPGTAWRQAKASESKFLRSCSSYLSGAEEWRAEAAGEEQNHRSAQVPRAISLLLSIGSGKTKGMLPSGALQSLPSSSPCGARAAAMRNRMHRCYQGLSALEHPLMSCQAWEGSRTSQVDQDRAISVFSGARDGSRVRDNRIWTHPCRTATSHLDRRPGSRTSWEQGTKGTQIHGSWDQSTSPEGISWGGRWATKQHIWEIMAFQWSSHWLETLIRELEHLS